MKKVDYKTPEIEVIRFDIRENIMEQITPGDGNIGEIGTTGPRVSNPEESTFFIDD